MTLGPAAQGNPELIDRGARAPLTRAGPEQCVKIWAPLPLVLLILCEQIICEYGHLADLIPQFCHGYTILMPHFMKFPNRNIEKPNGGMRNFVSPCI